MACISVFSASTPLQAAAAKQVVLIAGKKSHGPEGNRIHDYPWSVRLLKTLLEQSNVRDQVNVTTFFDGWPEDTSAIDRADTVMILSDGRDGDIGREAPHLASPTSRDTIQQLVSRGGGIMTFHFSTFAPDKFAEDVLNWYGGYFDWETDGEREWYSAIQTLEAEVQPSKNQHPILNGVTPFTMREEFYYNIRFRPNDRGWQPIWSVPALTTNQSHGKVVAWATERTNGSRGFATTCGHFYDNWQHENFRRTMLNAIAWTAKLSVPEQGVEAAYVTRDEIQLHLNGTRNMTRVETADETVYKEKPYWYKPGHPKKPAATATINTLPGFIAEQILEVPEEWGSFTALTVDSQGRLLAAAQHEAGIYRITPPPIQAPNDPVPVEKLGGAAKEFGWSHGLLHAFDSLDVTVSEENDSVTTGVHRLQDRDGDGQFDRAELIIPLDASGEHGPHNIVVDPNKKTMTMICGNGTPLPDRIAHTRPVATSGNDHLLPPGFESSRHTMAGWVMRFNPDGTQREVICSGLRNSFDLAYDQFGELFTFDSDMEWDLGTPWYRPTRICHLVSGGEFGWRGGAAKWPEHYEDSVGPVVNIGPASPTGIVFGYGTTFPSKYQKALFVCDWTYATVHAVHLQGEGASYGAEVEQFISGVGLPVTDIVVGKDGALYLAVGGRRLGSAIYRIRYNGPSHELSPPPQLPSREADQTLHDERRALERFHGRESRSAIPEAWPLLGHPDRSLRFAARVALESQPVEQWQHRALAEPNLPTALTGLLALARQGSPQNLDSVIHRLNELAWGQVTEVETLRALRAYEVALGRLEAIPPATSLETTERLRNHFPSGTASVDYEVARLLCFLGDQSILDSLLDLMEADNGERPELGSGYFIRNPKYGKAVYDMLESAPLLARMHFAQMALWLQQPWTETQRTRFFTLIGHAKSTSKGGHGYQNHWNQIVSTALDRLSESERDRHALLAAGKPSPVAEGLPTPEGPGREWTLEEALELVNAGLENRDLAHGQQTFQAAGCALCHRRNGIGGSIGPDLSSLSQRFTLQDILEATLSPSNAISDQYQVTTLELKDGSTHSGRVVSRDGQVTLIAPDLMKPAQTLRVDNDQIQSRRLEPVSLMPSGLLNPLNPEELLDLLAFLTQTP